jgi:hypothetical protein
VGPDSGDELLIIRNVHLGCETFGEILEGAPGLSRTLLMQRLKQLERLGIVESAPKPQGRGQRTGSRPRATICSRSAKHWAGGARWLEIAPEVEICKTYPGLDEDLYITADAEAFVEWHAGQLSWAQATRDSRIQLDGPAWLVRAFPTWNRRSMFAHIKPAAGAPLS